MGRLAGMVERQYPVKRGRSAIDSRHPAERTPGRLPRRCTIDDDPALAVARMPPRQASLALPLRLLLLSCVLVWAGCETLGGRGEPKAPPPVPPGAPLTPEPEPPGDEPLPVAKVAEPIVVAAWAEPKELPAGGGQVQILVRIQKRGGKRFPGVEVRLRSSTGSLYSAGRVLVTDASGMTRDRLTTKKTATITLNAGGTRYRFQVPVGESAP